MQFPEGLAARVRSDHAWKAAVASVFVLEAAVLLSGIGRQWYYFDEWRLIVERVAPSTSGVSAWFHQLFRPDSEHVIAVPLAVFIPIAKVFGADNYTPMLMVNVIVRLLTMWLVFDLAARAGARRITRLGAILLLALFGSGYESLFGQSLVFAGLTLVFSLAALRCAVVQRDVVGRDGLIAGGWLTLAVFSSSYAFPMVLGTAIAFGVRRSWRAAATSFAVPIITFVVVRAIEGSPYAPQEPFGLDRVAVSVDYVQAGLTAVGEGITGFEGLGVVAFVGLVVALVLASRTTPQWALAAAAVAVCVSFFAQASLSRSVFGAGQAASSRYVFFCAAPLIAALAGAWGDRRFTPRVAALLAIALVFSLASNVGRAIEGRQFYLGSMAESRQRLMVGLTAVERGTPELFPDPVHAIDLREDRIPVFLGWRGAQEFMADGRACFDRRVVELDALGVRLDVIDARLEAALVVLLNEHAIGFGPSPTTFGALVELAAAGTEENLVIGQLRGDYAGVVGAIDLIGDGTTDVERRTC